MNVYSIFNIPRGYSFMYIFNDIKCFYYYCRISSSRHYIYLFVNVTFITTNNCTFKSSILEYCCLANLTVAISFFFSVFSPTVMTVVWAAEFSHWAEFSWHRRVSHHVTSPDKQQAPLHHSRVPAPLPGHQLREVPLEARIHEWLLFIENEDVSLSWKWPYLPPIQIAFLHNKTWKLLICFVRQTH